nr:hypothetical protein CFP56_72197 [Quercus suber]
MSSNSFSGLLPLSLLNLPNLSTLYLHNNQLVGPLPNHHRIVILENINFFHGPQRHKTPFFAKLVGIVAVEVIGLGLLPLMFRNKSITSVLLNRSRPLQLTQRTLCNHSWWGAAVTDFNSAKETIQENFLMVFCFLLVLVSLQK